MATAKRSAQFIAVLMALLVAVVFMPLLSDSMQSHAAAKLKVSKTKVTVQAGKSVTVKAKGLSSKNLKKVKWSSSNTKVVNITKAKGKSTAIQGIKKGTAKVTAKYGKKKVTIKVTVEAAPASKTVNPNGPKKDGTVMDNDVSVTGYFQGDATVYSLLYQESAEVAAMQMQAFSLAKIRLDEAIAANTENKPLAIVTDIDSTIADDTCYVAGAVLDSAGRIGVKYFAMELAPWVNDDWCGYYQAVATTADTVIPGAKQFVDYAYKKGVEWFYITNRPYYELDLTVKQLENQGFFECYDPTKSGLGYTSSIVDAFKAVEGFQEYHYGGWYDTEENNKKLDEELAAYVAKVNEQPDLEMGAGFFSVKNDYRVQVQGSDFDSDKSDRRANAIKKVTDAGGKVVMYLGDSINDMVSDAESDRWGDKSKDFTRKQYNEQRTKNASDPYWAGNWGEGQSVADGEAYDPGHWGYDFIVLPNATYGDWFKATWAKGKKDAETGLDSGTAEGQAQYIYNQIWAHSYLNTDKFQTWYNGTSPVTNDVQ